MKIFYSTLILFYIVFNSVFAQQSEWIRSEGQCVIANITPEEAKATALQRARTEAIKIAVGINIREETFRNVGESITSKKNEYFDFFNRLNVTTSYGKIIDERIILDTLIFNNNYLLRKVIIDAKVEKERGLPDPNFKAEIVLDKDVFYVRKNGEGENLIFKLWANQDCYFYLFNIMSNDSVQVLLPNSFVKDNFYSASKEIQQYEKAFENLNFVAGIPNQKERVVEGLYLVALKEKIDFNSYTINTTNKNFMPSVSTAVTTIQSWLINIPLNKRTDALKLIEIRRFQ
jgi:hypothetical protein